MTDFLTAIEMVWKKEKTGADAETS
jgi:hypothetical protein